MIRLLCVLLVLPSLTPTGVTDPNSTVPPDEPVVSPNSEAPPGPQADPPPSDDPVVSTGSEAPPKPKSDPPAPTSGSDVNEESEETPQTTLPDDGRMPVDLSADVRLSMTFVDADLNRNQPIGAGLFHVAPLRLRIEEHDYEDLLYSRFLFAAVRARVPDAALGVDVEVGLASRVYLDDSTASIRDDSSYIKLSRSSSIGEIIFTAFPTNADRLRLGYSSAIAWGTGALFDSKLVPGAKVALDSDVGYAFLGAKAAPVQSKLNDGTTAERTAWGLLGGLGIRVMSGLHLELGAGRFMRGTIDKPEIELRPGERLRVASLTATGVSGQLSYAYGVVKQRPIDFQHLNNDPYVGDSGFAPHTVRDDVALLVNVESTILRQPLQDPDTPSQTKVQQAEAGAVSIRVARGSVVAYALYAYRSLPFILFTVPSSPSFVAFSEEADVIGEQLAGASLGYRIANIGLEPSAGLEVRRPASISTSPSAGNNPPTSLGQQTLIFNDLMGIGLLNPGEDVELVYDAKLSLKWLPGHTVAIVSELVVAHDRNRRRLGRDEGGIPVRLKAKPTSVGLNLIVRVRLP